MAKDGKDDEYVAARKLLSQTINVLRQKHLKQLNETQEALSRIRDLVNRLFQEESVKAVPSLQFVYQQPILDLCGGKMVADSKTHAEVVKELNPYEPFKMSAPALTSIMGGLDPKELPKDLKPEQILRGQVSPEAIRQLTQGLYGPKSAPTSRTLRSSFGGGTTRKPRSDLKLPDALAAPALTVTSASAITSTSSSTSTAAPKKGRGFGNFSQKKMVEESIGEMPASTPAVAPAPAPAPAVAPPMPNRVQQDQQYFIQLDDRMYTVYQNSLYQVDSDSSAKLVGPLSGALPNRTDPASFSAIENGYWRDRNGHIYQKSPTGLYQLVSIYHEGQMLNLY